MATCNQVIAAALKLGKVIPSGGTPSSDEYADGLEALQSMFDSWLAGGMFGRLEDVYLEANDTAEEGKRYFVPTGVTLTVPTSVYVDSDGNTRQPRDLSVYESLTQAGTRAAKIYDRTAWIDLLGLTASGACPLSERGRLGLAACLATHEAFLAQFDDVQVSPRVENLARKFMMQISYKLGSTRDRTAAEYF